jgi:altronate dehydratase
MKSNVLIINPGDNVGVALGDIQHGKTIHLLDGTEFEALNDIPFSHKIALEDISVGEEIVKYGEMIGQAREGIKKGELVHTHNLVVPD